MLCGSGSGLGCYELEDVIIELGHHSSLTDDWKELEDIWAILLRSVCFRILDWEFALCRSDGVLLSRNRFALWMQSDESLATRKAVKRVLSDFLSLQVR